MSSALSDKFLKTALGETHLTVSGVGPKLLIINGGPGFAHDYLRLAFHFLEKKYQLLFYDQPGCGRTSIGTSDISLEYTAQHLNSVIHTIAQDQPISILAHSWGCLVYLASISDIKDMEYVNDVIFVSPIPWIRSEYEKARNNFINTLSPPTLLKFTMYVQENRPGDEIMDLILPYYTPQKIPITGKDFKLNLQTYNIINNTLAEFDYSKTYDLLKSIHIILGDKDFTTPEQISNLLNNQADMTIMDTVGHFPFYEKPIEFSKILNSYL